MTPASAEPGDGFLSIAGRLLVATPLLLEPNFYRTVIYVAEHSADGAVGLVLNRPTEEPVSAHGRGMGYLRQRSTGDLRRRSSCERDRHWHGRSTRRPTSRLEPRRSVR